MLVVLAGWVVTIMTMAGNNLFGGEFDPLLLILQGLSIVAFGGGLVVLLANVWLSFRARRPWPTRIWSIAVALAVGVVLWFGLAFHLVGFTTQF